MWKGERKNRTSTGRGHGHEFKYELEPCAAGDGLCARLFQTIDIITLGLAIFATITYRLLGYFPC